MSDLQEAIESYRRRELIAGCRKIDANLGAAVEEAFDAGYSADAVHAMLSAGNLLTSGDAK